MKVYKNILYPLILILSIVLFISCDLLFPAPLGRDNPLDDEVQIGGFDAVVSGSDSIITIWDWRNPAPGIDDSRIIDKIRIVYSENNPPSSKYPLNPDNVQEFTSNSEFQFQWTNLKQDREHYFALYAHEKGGVWLAPKTVKQNISYDGHLVASPWWSEKLFADTSAPANIVGTAPPDISGPIIGFIRFDDLFDSRYGAVLDARVQNFGVTTPGDIDIVPMRRKIDSGMTWDEISDSILYDYEHSITVSMLGGIIIDIKDQINIARVHGSNTIAFIPVGTGVSIDINPIDYWDATLMRDLFSVWDSWW